MVSDGFQGLVIAKASEQSLVFVTEHVHSKHVIPVYIPTALWSNVILVKCEVERDENYWLTRWENGR